MTTIRLLTSGQHLGAVQKVKLASGDVDSVFLDVSFDSSWDEFTARTAVFYTSQDDTVLEMLLIDNKCTVPHEVLAKEGTLFIGVRAVTTDGTKIKTSSIVKLKIVQGANAAYTTISPTMDLYQQYLAALREGAEPILNKIKADVDAYVATINTLIEVYKGNFVMPCDFGNVLTTLTVDKEATDTTPVSKVWTASESCWVQIYIDGMNDDDSATLKVDGNAVLTLSFCHGETGQRYESYSTPVCVKSGSVISLDVIGASSISWLKAYGCINGGAE